MVRRIAILDVGHGNAAIVTDDNWSAVIDAGPGGALLRFLETEQILKIDEILISHADEDHIGGLVGILSSGLVSVGRVRLNSDAAKDSQVWKDLAEALDDAQRRGNVDFRPSLTPADSGSFDHGDVHIEVLAPSSFLATRGPGSTDRNGKTITTNSVSAVIRVIVAGRPLVLFPGDIDELGLDELEFVGTTDLRADVLVFPHHGGRGGSTSHTGFATRIISMVAPQSVVFSIGRGKHQTPSPAVVAAVRAANGQVRVACTQLSEHCATDVPKSAPTHLATAYARGRERNECCGGTFLIDFDGAGAVLPNRAGHEAFIRGNAPTALCMRQPGR